MALIIHPQKGGTDVTQQKSGQLWMAERKYEHKQSDIPAHSSVKKKVGKTESGKWGGQGPPLFFCKNNFIDTNQVFGQNAAQTLSVVKNEIARYSFFKAGRKRSLTPPSLKLPAYKRVSRALLHAGKCLGFLETKDGLVICREKERRNF
ncbi:MAG: hypothetical protein K9M51_02500 [Candidatus Gracilibacteria bacterium]|nr:hypothetical protein [Candidatus Gracilibacteria bacterium]